MFFTTVCVLDLIILCLEMELSIETLATSMKISLKNRLRILSNHFAIFPSRPVT